MAAMENDESPEEAFDAGGRLLTGTELMLTEGVSVIFVIVGDLVDATWDLLLTEGVSATVIVGDSVNAGL